MRALINIGAIQRQLQRFIRDESGATLVELAIVMPVFFLLLFGLIDFGRMGAEYVLANKATQIAARLAAVRPPLQTPYCTGTVPNTNARGSVPSGTVPPQFGTMCSAGASICANPGVITCTGNLADPTFNEIWVATSGLMPTSAAPANLTVSYTYNSNLGFLGGPYTPIVTVEITGLTFQFATPLSSLAALASANQASAPGAAVTFPSMSMSLPAEDLNLGDNG